MYLNWPLTFVKSFQKKRYIARNNAIEFMLMDGSALLLNFYEKDREEVIERLLIHSKELNIGNN